MRIFDKFFDWFIDVFMDNPLYMLDVRTWPTFVRRIFLFTIPVSGPLFLLFGLLVMAIASVCMLGLLLLVGAYSLWMGKTEGDVIQAHDRY